MLQSLGFNVPPQTPFSIHPDTAGFIIYSDFIGPFINYVSYSSGPINFYSPDSPNNDHYSLSWKNFSQYNAIGFDFKPDKDLSVVLSRGYAVDFMVRGNEPGIKFDIRFMDTKTEIPGDHSWRMGSIVDENDATWDRKWHHVRIP